MKFVVDSSAILAVMLGEPCADETAEHVYRANISAVNLQEILTKFVDQGTDHTRAVIEVSRFELQVAAHDHDQATVAATLRESTRPYGLSLGDRSCLALALTKKLPVLTADRNWSAVDVGVDIRQIR